MCVCNECAGVLAHHKPARSPETSARCQNQSLIYCSAYRTPSGSYRCNQMFPKIHSEWGKNQILKNFLHNTECNGTDTHTQKHTHPLEKGKENIAWGWRHLSDRAEGLGGGQQRHDARDCSLCGWSEVIEKGSAVQLSVKERENEKQSDIHYRSKV